MVRKGSKPNLNLALKTSSNGAAESFELTRGEDTKFKGLKTIDTKAKSIALVFVGEGNGLTINLTESTRSGGKHEKGEGS
jgi:hypothetical protein